MRPDVIDLNQFYATRLGQTARRLIRRRIRVLWPSTVGMRVLGLGYATPFLRPFRDEAERVIAMMPASQGVSAWPAGEPNLVGLCDEAEIPLPDSSIDRVLMVHALETSEQNSPAAARGMARTGVRRSAHGDRAQSTGDLGSR